MGSLRGATLIILLLLISALIIGLMVAVPVWQTQVQREKEEELIFRGGQVVEAVRLFQTRNPGRFPRSLQELYESRCLRRLFKDPMTPSGEWNLILWHGVPGPGPDPGESPQRVLLIPQSLLSTMTDPRIVGVASSSRRKSIRVYNQAESYDNWLFYYGQDPKVRPEVIRLGKPGPGR